MTGRFDAEVAAGRTAQQAADAYAKEMSWDPDATRAMAASLERARLGPWRGR